MIKVIRRILIKMKMRKMKVIVRSLIPVILN